ncbi:MAG: WbqC family protein [Actinomycetota bacterium]
MKVAVMQPYLFPYLGYVHLLDAVDHFVVLDDVNHIKRGWVSRNRFLVDGEARFVTLPVERASQNRRINEHRIFEPERSLPDLHRRIVDLHRHHPDIVGTRGALDELFAETTDDLVTFLVRSLRCISSLCGVEVPMSLASTLDVPRRGTAQERIIELASRLGATEYVNLSGGRDLYDPAAFAEAGLALSFVDSRFDEYPQLGADPFVPGLSVLDLLFNAPDRSTVEGQVGAHALDRRALEAAAGWPTRTGEPAKSGEWS